MDAERERKDVYRAVVAAVGVGDLAALDVLLVGDLIDHNPMPDQAPGIVGFKQWAAAVRSSFPDLRGHVEAVLAEGNLVAGHVLWRGTQQGWFLGVPPSDRQVEISAFHIVRFSGGRIAEWWGTADLLGALQQLGAQVVPPPRLCLSAAGALRSHRTSRRHGCAAARPRLSVLLHQVPSGRLTA